MTNEHVYHAVAARAIPLSWACRLSAALAMGCALQSGHFWVAALIWGSRSQSNGKPRASGSIGSICNLPKARYPPPTRLRMLLLACEFVVAGHMTFHNVGGH